MKRIVSIVVFFTIASVGFAQNKIIVQGSFPDLYIIHKTAGKESLTSISKLYNLATTPVVKISDVADNGMVAANREVKIPLSKTNFTQDGQTGEGETLIPLYHIVQKNENLYRISQIYGKLRIDFLREWNDLNSDVIQLAQKVVIGHLKVAKEKALDIIAGVQPTTGDGSDNGYEAKEDKKPEPKKQPEPAKPETKPSPSTDDNDEGFFVTQYPSDSKGKLQIKTGEAATFKTTSGWSDRKYYVLMNDMVPGTIVRITGPNNKSICAKVLGALPEMKENKTLLVRMSNATASALHISDASFQVQVSYFK